MNTRRRQKLSRIDLELALQEQISLLIHACDSYDKGFEAIGKHIAVILRVLLHNTSVSRALLDQLGYRKIKFYDTAGVQDPENLMSSCGLVAMRIVTNIGGSYIPKFQAGSGDEPSPDPKINFTSWWNNHVYKDINNNFMNRRELILNVANTDGGGHVDPGLDELYYAFSKKNALGWTFSNGKIEKTFDGKPELVCMRQIAHEVTKTLLDEVPQLFPT